MKRKLNKIDGHDPWEVEVAYYINVCQLDPVDARAWTIIRWMYLGDLRPLSAEIKKQGTAIDGAVLGSLERMIDEGLLTVKPRGRGRPTQPATTIRNTLAALRHENRDIKSADAIQAIADEFGMSDELVRRAIRHRRKLTT
jgi:hypothetical protein